MCLDFLLTIRRKNVAIIDLGGSVLALPEV